MDEPGWNYVSWIDELGVHHYGPFEEYHEWFMNQRLELKMPETLELMRGTPEEYFEPPKYMLGSYRDENGRMTDVELTDRTDPRGDDWREIFRALAYGLLKLLRTVPLYILPVWYQVALLLYLLCLTESDIAYMQEIEDIGGSMDDPGPTSICSYPAANMFELVTIFALIMRAGTTLESLKAKFLVYQGLYPIKTLPYNYQSPLPEEIDSNQNGIPDYLEILH